MGQGKEVAQLVEGHLGGPQQNLLGSQGPAVGGLAQTVKRDQGHSPAETRLAEDMAEDRYEKIHREHTDQFATFPQITRLVTFDDPTGIVLQPARVEGEFRRRQPGQNGAGQSQKPFDMRRDGLGGQQGRLTDRCHAQVKGGSLFQGHGAGHPRPGRCAARGG